MLLEARDIHKSYRLMTSQLEVLKGIDISIRSGEMIAIVGPSGAGKSTLMHILGGLDLPTKGQITYDGQDVYQLRNAARAKLRNEGIGFIFQFYHLLPEFTAEENVMLPALIKNNQRNSPEVAKQARKLLERVGLGERVHHKPKELSGGEQQRVAIARAVINEPDIIFCDEPTGNLDSASGNEIIKLLMDLNKKNNLAVVIVTHDEKIAKKCHSVVQLRDGKIV